MLSPCCPARRRRKARQSQRSVLALSDDLLKEILVRVGSPVDLVLASTACVAFRRLIVDPIFLRRYRSLHPPLFLGLLCLSYPPAVRDFRAIVAPHPNAPLRDTLASAADFSFSFLPPRPWFSWDLCDVRDGRVLLSLDHETCTADLAVCDPMSRQYVLLPAIPDGLLASIQVREQDILGCEAFFVPSGDTEETPFKVICRAHSVTKFLVLVYSSSSDHWSIACTSWNSLSLNVIQGVELLISPQQWAYHCCYWKIYLENKLLKLDTKSMEFSTVDLPPDHYDRQCAIVEVEGGKIAMFSLTLNGPYVYYDTFLQNDGEKANGWHLRNSIRLPARYQWNIKNVAEGYIFLVGTRRYYKSVSSLICSLEIKTFIMKRIIKIKDKNPYYYIYPYFCFPPFMSPRGIQGDEVLQG